MRAARKADVHLATLPRLTTFKAQGPHEGKAMGLKIYLSSTFEDLKDYRRRVYDQLRTLRHDVIAMEDYVTADERPLDKCLRDVRDSDVYIGLTPGGRTTPTTPSSARSRRAAAICRSATGGSATT